MEPTKEISLILTGTLPEITGNFDACKAYYQSELTRYAVVVQPDKLPIAKADLAKLRGEIKRLDRIRIDEATRLKTPITKMEAKVKELTTLIQTTANQIAAQVKACEEKTLAGCRSLMNGALNVGYLELGVRTEYQTGFDLIEPLVGLSALTGKGALTKQSAESIKGLAQQARGAQDRTDGRLARLEADCRAAGIEPLQKIHVARFLDESDVVYAVQLQKLIKVEVERAEADRKKRQAEEEAKARAKVAEEAREAKAKADREAKEKADAEEAAKPKEAPAHQTPSQSSLRRPDPAPATEAIVEPLPPALPPLPALPGASVPRQPVTVVIKYKILAKRPADLAKIIHYFVGALNPTKTGIPEAFTVECVTEGYRD